MSSPSAAQVSPAPELRDIAHRLMTLFLQHGGHDRFTDDCKICIFMAAWNHQCHGVKEEEAEAYLSSMAIDTINDAVIELSTLFRDSTVKPYPVRFEFPPPIAGFSVRPPLAMEGAKKGG